MKKELDEVAQLLAADDAYHASIIMRDRYSITINAGFPDKDDKPEKVIDDAIQRGLAILVGTALIYLRLVSVTTTVLKVSYGEMVLVTVIAEPLPKRDEVQP